MGHGRGSQNRIGISGGHFGYGHGSTRAVESVEAGAAVVAADAGLIVPAPSARASAPTAVIFLSFTVITPRSGAGAR